MILPTLIWLNYFSAFRSEVIELNDGVLGLLNERAWLINFYAPWCGFCRKLEPVFEKASVEIEAVISVVKVARLDATIHHGAGKLFNIKGYPTIKFINGSTSYTYNGDRSVRSIVAFTARASGNAVKLINNASEFESNCRYWSPDALFILLNPQHGSLQTAYYGAADKLRLFLWLFEAPKDAIPKRFSGITTHLADSEEMLVVIKGEDVFSFSGVQDAPAANRNDLLIDQVTQWLLLERYPILPYMTETDLWDFGANELAAASFATDTLAGEKTDVRASLHRAYRLVALALVNLASSSSDARSTHFKQLVYSLARKRLGSLANHFQFAWTDQVGSVSEVALLSLSAPSLVVVDPVARIVYLNPNQTELEVVPRLEEDVLVAFLTSAAKDQLTGFGGHTFAVRVRRLLRTSLITLHHISYTSPLLALTIFGAPILLLSFICYLCCCLDSPGITAEEMRARMRTPCPRGTPSQTGTSRGQSLIRTANAAETESTNSELYVRQRVPHGSGGNWRRCEKFTVVGPVCSEEEIDAKRGTLSK